MVASSPEVQLHPDLVDGLREELAVLLRNRIEELFNRDIWGTSEPIEWPQDPPRSILSEMEERFGLDAAVRNTVVSRFSR